MSSGDDGRVSLSACGGALRADSEIAFGWPDEEAVWLGLRFEADTVGPAAVPGLGAGHLRTGSLVRDGIEVVREVHHPDAQPDAVACRLRLINRTGADLRVSRLTPLSVGADGLRLGETPAGDWVYVRAPRKKNDMPACVRLGDDGPGIWDAVRGTPETGGLPQGAGGVLPQRYVSSELTALTGGGTAAAFGFLPLDRQLVQSLLTLAPDRVRLESLRLDCLCDGQVVADGAQMESQWVVVRFASSLETAVGAYTECLQRAQPRRPSGAVYPRPPTVWCSWYYYGNGFTQEECEANLDALARRPLPIDVFQIDECWDLHWGDWGPNDDWPDLRGVATRARELGMAPGIWVCPVLAEPRCRIHHAHRDWLLRDREGRPITFSMGGMHNYVLDPTVPEAHAYIRSIFHWLRQDLGYTYFKLDFMRAVGEPGGVFADPAVNRAQAFRLALEAVRGGAGDDAYVNVCGGFYGPALGLADAQRSGSDVKSIWPAPPDGEEAAGYGPFAIKQNSLRHWMNDLWHNDPDALMVRRRATAARDEPLSIGLLNGDEALTCALNQYLGGGLVCFTENLAEIDNDRLFLLRHCAPSLDAAAVPRDFHDAPRFPAVFDTAVPPAAAG
ncbi:MAG: glycoside hydrolase family 36 protein, partial [Planctomycetota bacterium]